MRMTMQSGEVLKLARNFRSIEKFSLPGSTPRPIETPSAEEYPAMNPKPATLVTGIYVPPGRTRILTMGDLEALGTPVLHRDASAALSHLLTGDFNLRSWMPLFEEWCSQQGLRDLSGPADPAISAGSAAD